MPLFPTTTTDKPVPILTDRILLSSTPDGWWASDCTFQEMIDALEIPVNSEVVHVTWDESVAWNKTFSWILKFASALWRKISFYWDEYFIWVQSGLFQIWSQLSTTRVWIWWGTTGSFIETLSVKWSFVWIWTITPQQPLHVLSATANTWRIRVTETADTTDAHFAWFEISDWGTVKWGLFKNGLSGDMLIYTLTEAIRILASNNNVWIWITAPTEKLHVSGNIKASWSAEVGNTSWFKLGSSATMVWNTTTSSIDFIIP